MYTPFLIANYATGLDRRLQPWLSQEDSQQELFDGYVYRGTLSKREGYTYFADGLEGGQPYTESRIVHRITDEATGQNNTGAVLTPITLANPPVRRGTVTVSDTVESHTDDGLGTFPTAAAGTIDYTTGIITGFQFNAASGFAVTVTYDFIPDDPVMMVASFYTSLNTRELIVASTKYVNRYNTNLNILDDISPATAYTGNSHQFFTWTNYADATDNPRLLFANNKDKIQQYDGTTVTDYAFTSATITTLTCLLMVDYKDRLILLRTNEDGTVFPRRIRVSGTGANCDNFDTSATGAGFIDIPDNTWIMGCAFNRDDLIIFTEGSTWTLKYTGNDTTPFVLNKIDESRGSQAPFAAITYLNRTSAASPRGLIMTDGYRVERQDLSIPDFSFNEVDGANFDLCFAGSVDADRDHYLIYPTQNQDVGSEESKRILTTNYDEDNYSIYRLPLSCMGTYVNAFNISWNDLLSYANWDELSNDYGNWREFSYSKGAPMSIGGGHHGEIWQLAQTESEDNPVRVRNITVISPGIIEVTTDWNNYSLNADDQEMGVDYIFLTGVEGMVEVNGKQFPILSITNNNVFTLNAGSSIPSTSAFNAYTGGGIASRVIPFEALFKKFNPFADQDKKVRCGWLYMYVDTTGTDLTRNILIKGVSNTDPCLITTTVNHNLSTGDQVYLYSIGGTTELNGTNAFITIISLNSFSLNGVDSTAFGVYTTGGFASVSEPAKMDIDIIVNDDVLKSQLQSYGPEPYQGNCTNLKFEDGSKKWYKVYINQTGRFIQFRLRNTQAGAIINVQATMPGFQPVGRMI